MRDHLHALLQLPDGTSLSRLVNRLKSVAAIDVNRFRGSSGRVWSRGFHDHALRRDEDLVAVARYVIANPVRAGLVDRAGCYPFWDAAWLG